MWNATTVGVEGANRHSDWLGALVQRSIHGAMALFSCSYS